MEIISVNIQKGGCGKTTSVQCLSEILSSQYGLRVLCVDTDAQCSLTILSGVSPEECENNIYTLLRGESTLSASILHTKYYDLVPGSVLMSPIDMDFHEKKFLLKEILKDADYDIVFIDTPPALGPINIMSLAASTKVLIPTECSYPAMIGLNQLYLTIQAVKLINSRLELLGLVMIKFNGRMNVNNVILEAMEQTAKAMGTKVYEAKVRETVKIREAQSQLTPILDWDENCTAVYDYKILAEEIYSDLKKC